MMQNSRNFYNKLLAFDIDRIKETNINFVKELLYKFSYSNLADVFDHPVLIRKSVINYLYTGFFTLSESEDITDEAKQCLSKILEYEDYDTLNELEQKLGIKKQELEACTNDEKRNKISEDITKIESKIKAVNVRLGKKVDFDAFYDQVHENWEIIHLMHNKLIIDFVEQKKTVKYLIVYEAPPYEDTNNKYFLNSNAGTYGNPIKECFSNSKSTDVISEILVENDAIYFDLIMAGIPIADAEIKITRTAKPKPIRYFWSTDNRWEIGGKKLPIVLLELGIFHLFNMGINFDKRPFIAIGTPLNTSASLFEYYSKNYLEVYSNEIYIKKKEPKNITHEDFENVVFKLDSKCMKEYLIANLSLVNTPSTYEIRGTYGETYPLFKSNIIGSSNYPHANLLKNAFNIT